MRFFVTGAGGFIGSHVVEALLHAGHEVRALVRSNSGASWGHLEGNSAAAQGKLEVRPGDVTDAWLMRSLVDGCEVVLHLAALIGIPYSRHAPASYMATNVGGTLNILEASRGARARRVIIASSSEVYGTGRCTPIDERHPLEAQAPYCASKIAADKLAESYFHSFDLPVVTLRPFNTYGPRQSARAVIPTILAQALSGVSEIRLGNLEPKRDLTFVGDVTRAFLLAAETPSLEGEVIQVGQGDAVSVGELAQRCLDAVGSKARIISVPELQRAGKSEAGLLVCDAGKARRILNWTPQVSLDEGLRRTADYLRENLGQHPHGDHVT